MITDREKNFLNFQKLFELAYTSTEEYEEQNLPPRYVEQLRNLRTWIRIKYTLNIENNAEIENFENDPEDHKMVKKYSYLTKAIRPYLEKALEVEESRRDAYEKLNKKQQQQYNQAEEKKELQKACLCFDELHKLVNAEEDYQDYSLSDDDRKKLGDLSLLFEVYNGDLMTCRNVELILEQEDSDEENIADTGISLRNIMEDYHYLVKVVYLAKPTGVLTRAKPTEVLTRAVGFTHATASWYLTLSEDAGRAEIQRRYVALSKLYHTDKGCPDKEIGYDKRIGIARNKADCDRIFSRITEATEFLRGDKKGGRVKPLQSQRNAVTPKKQNTAPEELLRSNYTLKPEKIKVRNDALKELLRSREKPRAALLLGYQPENVSLPKNPRPAKPRPASAGTSRALQLIRKHNEEDFTKYTKVVQSIIKKVLENDAFEINKKQENQLKAAFVKCDAGKTYDIKREVNGRGYIIINNSVVKKKGKHLKVYIS